MEVNPMTVVVNNDPIPMCFSGPISACQRSARKTKVRIVAAIEANNQPG
jgi:hypothetical protein